MPMRVQPTPILIKCQLLPIISDTGDIKNQVVMYSGGNRQCHYIIFELPHKFMYLVQSWKFQELSATKAHRINSECVFTFEEAIERCRGYILEHKIVASLDPTI